MSQPPSEVGILFARNCARVYAATVLGTTSMPDFPYEAGLFRRDDLMANKAFMDELQRIAARIEKKIPDEANLRIVTRAMNQRCLELGSDPVAVERLQKRFEDDDVASMSRTQWFAWIDKLPRNDFLALLALHREDQS